MAGGETNRRIIQVLNNLLSNAARHSDSLSPTRVTIVLHGVHVAFSVADDGVGLPAERLPHLFREFSQPDGEERGRDIGGSGLGLAIRKGIVEAQRAKGIVEAQRAGPAVSLSLIVTSVWATPKTDPSYPGLSDRLSRNVSASSS